VVDLLMNPNRILDEWASRQRGDGVASEVREQRDEAARQLSIQSEA
jgi:hypothetical protein